MATRDQIRDFLTKLGTDSNFRSKLEADPVGTMNAHGFALKAADVPAEGIKLPPSHKVLENLDTLIEKMDATAGEVFFKA
jgi:hypothetical protein